ncbi:MAG: NAD(P)/FAD-dependent oxidoreductase [Bacteroidia bacterium]
MNLSHWEYTSFFKDIDVAIIGSGIVGLNAAIALKEADSKRKIVVLERGIIPSGASTRNAGFACFGSMTELIDDIQTMGEDAVWELVKKRWLGLKGLRQTLGDKAIGYEHRGGFELFRPSEGETYEACLAKMPVFNQALTALIGEKEVFVANRERLVRCRFGGVNALIHNQAEGQIHTGNMMKALLHKARSLDIDIFNGLTISEITESASGVNLLISNGWELKASQVIVATNGFARQLLAELSVRPARNQVWLTQEIPKLAWEGCYHYDKGYVYFRNIGKRVLIGGARNLDSEGETTDDFGQSPIIEDALKQLLDEVVLPDQAWQLERKWSGILGVGPEKRPILERQGERVVLAVRLGGMGVAIGSWVGQEAARLIR